MTTGRHEDLVNRVENWKFSQALNYLTGEPIDVVAQVTKMAARWGNIGWWDPDDKEMSLVDLLEPERLLICTYAGADTHGLHDEIIHVVESFLFCANCAERLTDHTLALVETREDDITVSWYCRSCCSIDASRSSRSRRST